MTSYDVYAKEFKDYDKREECVAGLISKKLISPVKLTIPHGLMQKGYRINLSVSTLAPNVITIIIDSSFELYPPIGNIIKKFGFKYLVTRDTEAQRRPAILLGDLVPEIGLYCLYLPPILYTQSEAMNYKNNYVFDAQLIIQAESPGRDTSYYTIPEYYYAERWRTGILALKDKIGVFELLKKLLKYPTSINDNCKG